MAHSPGPGSVSNIQVIVRIRPSNNEEGSDLVNFHLPSNPTDPQVIGYFNPKLQRDVFYQYDAVLTPAATQHHTYQAVGRHDQVLDSFLGGYNCSIFGYGNTGSGKSFSLGFTNDVLGSRGQPKSFKEPTGPGLSLPLTAVELANSAQIDLHKGGVFQHISTELFARLNQFQYQQQQQLLQFQQQQQEQQQLEDEQNPTDGPFTSAFASESTGDLASSTTSTTSTSQEHTQPPQQSIKLQMSLVEIYMDEVFDLLDTTHKKDISIRDNPDGSSQLVGVREVSVDSILTLFHNMEAGIKRRQLACTAMNSQSSRSHCILTLYLTRTTIASDGISTTVTSKLNMIDLAGSERLAKTNAVGDTMKQGISINSSLSALTRVISAIIQKQKLQSEGFAAKAAQLHVPFRESTITRLLRDSLDGHSRTILLACLSPASVHEFESISTLNFAHSVRGIKVNAVVQKDKVTIKMEQLEAQVDQLQKENDQFRLQLGLPPQLTLTTQPTQHHTKPTGPLPSTFDSTALLGLLREKEEQLKSFAAKFSSALAHLQSSFISNASPDQNGQQHSLLTQIPDSLSFGHESSLEGINDQGINDQASSPSPSSQQLQQLFIMMTEMQSILKPSDSLPQLTSPVASMGDEVDEITPLKDPNGPAVPSVLDFSSIYDAIPNNTTHSSSSIKKSQDPLYNQVFGLNNKHSSTDDQVRYLTTPQMNEMNQIIGQPVFTFNQSQQQNNQTIFGSSHQTRPKPVAKTNSYCDGQSGKIQSTRRQFGPSITSPNPNVPHPPSSNLNRRTGLFMGKADGIKKQLTRQQFLAKRSQLSQFRSNVENLELSLQQLADELGSTEGNFQNESADNDDELGTKVSVQNELQNITSNITSTIKDWYDQVSLVEEYQEDFVNLFLMGEQIKNDRISSGGSSQQREADFLSLKSSFSQRKKELNDINSRLISRHVASDGSSKSGSQNSNTSNSSTTASAPAYLVKNIQQLQSKLTQIENLKATQYKAHQAKLSNIMNQLQVSKKDYKTILALNRTLSNRLTSQQMAITNLKSNQKFLRATIDRYKTQLAQYRDHQKHTYMSGISSMNNTHSKLDTTFTSHRGGHNTTIFGAHSQASKRIGANNNVNSLNTTITSTSQDNCSASGHSALANSLGLKQLPSYMLPVKNHPHQSSLSSHTAGNSHNSLHNQSLTNPVLTTSSQPPPSARKSHLVKQIPTSNQRSVFIPSSSAQTSSRNHARTPLATPSEGGSSSRPNRFGPQSSAVAPATKRPLPSAAVDFNTKSTSSLPSSLPSASSSSSSGSLSSSSLPGTHYSGQSQLSQTVCVKSYDGASGVIEIGPHRGGGSSMETDCSNESPIRAQTMGEDSLGSTVKRRRSNRLSSSSTNSSSNRSSFTEELDINALENQLVSLDTQGVISPVPPPTDPQHFPQSIQEQQQQQYQQQQSVQSLQPPRPSLQPQDSIKLRSSLLLSSSLLQPDLNSSHLNTTNSSLNLSRASLSTAGNNNLKSPLNLNFGSLPQGRNTQAHLDSLFDCVESLARDLGLTSPDLMNTSNLTTNTNFNSSGAPKVVLEDLPLPQVFSNGLEDIHEDCEEESTMGNYTPVKFTRTRLSLPNQQQQARSQPQSQPQPQPQSQPQPQYQQQDMSMSDATPMKPRLTINTSMSSDAHMKRDLISPTSAQGGNTRRLTTRSSIVQNKPQPPVAKQSSLGLLPSIRGHPNNSANNSMNRNNENR